MFKVNNKNTQDIFNTFSQYFIVESREYLLSSFPAEIKGQTNKNQETCNDKYNLSNINKTGQTLT